MKNKTIKKQVVFVIFLYYILYCSGPASTLPISMGIKVGHGLVFSAALSLEVTTKLTTSILIWICENAAKHDHVCMCAMCIHCYNKMQSNEEQPSR